MISETLKMLAASLRKEAESAIDSKKVVAEKVAKAILGVEQLGRRIK